MKLMTHVVVGYPSLDETITLVKAMVAAGADMVELQIPFSDPMADGPTIMKACEASLAQGTTVADAFKVMRELSEELKTPVIPSDPPAGGESRNLTPNKFGELDPSTRLRLGRDDIKTVPLYFMAYYNTVFRYGTEKFCKDAKAAGATGLIVPDMPIEEESEEHFFAFCKQYGLENIRVVSPASTDERLALNATYASGFVYATARQGITGAKAELPTETKTYLENVKKHMSLPLAVGFGISKPEHIKALEGIADIAIVGSAIIDIINEKKDVKEFIQTLKGEAI